MTVDISERESVNTIKRASFRLIGSLRAVFTPRRAVVGLIVLVLLIFVFYLTLLCPNSFGYYNDDAIYLSTAKALATGHGYRLIDLPYGPSQTKYPPLFPFLLSLIWRVRPDFPGNLIPMMMVSVVASVLGALVTWIYLTRFRYANAWWLLIIVGLAAINVNTIQFSIGVFSEMVYALFAVIALLLAEEYEEKNRSGSQGMPLAIVLGLAMGFAFLTRVAGITLPLAVGLYFIFRGRLKQTLVPLAIVGSFVFAWGVWTHHNRTTFVEPNAVFHTDYLRYSYNLIRDAQLATHRPIVITGGRMIAKNAVQLVGYWVPAETLGSYTDWLPAMTASHRSTLIRCICILALLFIAVGMRRDRLPRMRLLPIYVLLYVGLHITLPFHLNTYDRYLTPILPFTLLYLFKGLSSSTGLSRFAGSHESRSSVMTPRFAPRLARYTLRSFAALAGLIVLGFGTVSYSTGLVDTLKHEKSNAIDRSSEDAPAFEWLKANTPPATVIATVQHPMYYMYTGRKATLCFATEGPPRQTLKWQIGQLRKIIGIDKVDYLVLCESDFASKAGGVDYEKVVQRFVDSNEIALAFESPQEKVWIYRCFRDPPR